MRIVINRAADQPPFLQVRSQIETAIRSRQLPVGTRLPPVRELAGRLQVAPGTVARAYRELDAQGLVETRGRHGTFISDPAADRTLNHRQLAELAEAYARTAAQLGIRPGVASDLIEQALRSPADS